MGPIKTYSRQLATSCMWHNACQLINCFLLDCRQHLSSPIKLHYTFDEDISDTIPTITASANDHLPAFGDFNLGAVIDIVLTTPWTTY